VTFHESFGNGSLSKIAEILWVPALLALLSCLFLGYLLNVWPARSARSAAVSVPTVSGEVIGPPQVVFDTREACEQIDVPDAPARAFRDDRGIVHLVASHYVARAMMGPSLDQLKHDCRVIYRSPQDPDPSHFQDNNWLYSFYTPDGLRIAALVHSEYDADTIPGMCATPKDTNNCWWNTVTFAESLDGGYSFRVPAPPQNLVAAYPYRYIVGNRASMYGYFGPTNIIKVGGFYYALINNWPYKEQREGACLVRTSDVFAPQSWRAWDGRDFRIRFADPYRETLATPQEHVCQPVFAGAADSLLQHQRSGNFIVTQFVNDERFNGPPGFYIQASHDLMHWSKPSLLIKLSDLLAADGRGNWTYSYVSLLDPASADRNFSTVSDTPYVYYVRSDADQPPYARVLFRRRIKLAFAR
jgi:hypothetical protein